MMSVLRLAHALALASFAAVVGCCPVTLAPPALPPITSVPGFGCFAQSSSEAACVVGRRGQGLAGGTEVVLAFSGGGASIDLVRSADEAGADALPPAVVGAVAARLDGFQPLELGPGVEATLNEGELRVGPPASWGMWTVSLDSRRVAEAVGAPRFHTTLTVRGPMMAPTVIDEGERVATRISVNLFPQHQGVVVQQTFDHAGERGIGTYGQAWRCEEWSCHALR